jgi:hypothetical protein
MGGGPWEDMREREWLREERCRIKEVKSKNRRQKQM